METDDSKPTPADLARIRKLLDDTEDQWREMHRRIAEGTYDPTPAQDFLRELEAKRKAGK